MLFAPPSILSVVQFYGQQIELRDLAVIGLLILLEGVLSIDNALVLGLLAKRLPKYLQGKALTYGLIGAFFFRLIAIGTAQYLLRWHWVKLLGGAYLVYVAAKHFLFETSGQHDSSSSEPDAATSTGEDELRPVAAAPLPGLIAKPTGFWPTVLVIELTDIAFAIDSIVAAIALVGRPPAGHDSDALHPKFWVVLTGGMFGVILMRFAAVLFIKLLDRFPRFEAAAYLLVIVIGGKLLVDWGFNPADPNQPARLDFHSWRHPAFWVFWLLMIGSFCVGFLPRRVDRPKVAV